MECETSCNIALAVSAIEYEFLQLRKLRVRFQTVDHTTVPALRIFKLAQR
jgi:hypothetical protein